MVFASFFGIMFSVCVVFFGFSEVVTNSIILIASLYFCLDLIVSRDFTHATNSGNHSQTPLHV